VFLTPAVEHSAKAEAMTQTKQVLFAKADPAEDKNSTKPAPIVIDLLDEPKTDDNKKVASKPKPPKREHGLIVIKGCDTNGYLKNRGSHLTVVFVKPEDKSIEAPYSNRIHLLATILTLTPATHEAMDSLKSVKNIDIRKNFRAINITGFLERNDVTITAIADSESYKKIITSDHSSPIIIKYAVARHKLEDESLPISWVQFCLLYSKENLLVPFNEVGHNISLGKQFCKKT
jgi:hypothetical protein